MTSPRVRSSTLSFVVALLAFSWSATATNIANAVYPRIADGLPLSFKPASELGKPSVEYYLDVADASLIVGAECGADEPCWVVAETVVADLPLRSVGARKLLRHFASASATDDALLRAPSVACAHDAARTPGEVAGTPP
jgi:hypothetical protein